MHRGIILSLNCPVENRIGYCTTLTMPGLGCSNKRSPRMQPFTWNADGTPHFGKPVKEGEPVKIPK